MVRLYPESDLAGGSGDHGSRDSYPVRAGATTPSGLLGLANGRPEAGGGSTLGYSAVAAPAAGDGSAGATSPHKRRAPDLPQGGIVDWEPSTFLARGPAATTTFHRPSPTAVLLLLWLSGVVGAAVMAGREGFAVIRLRRSCGLIDRPELRDAMIELARVFGLRSVPELMAGPTVARPMVVGAAADDPAARQNAR